MGDFPAEIWIDLDQISQGYTDKPDEATPHDVRYVCGSLHDALANAVRKSLPMMRRNAFYYLDSHAVKGRIETISRMDYDEVADDLAAIVATEGCIGKVPDIDDVDTAWLDAAIARFSEVSDGSF